MDKFEGTSMRYFQTGEGGGIHMAGGDAKGGGGMHVHPVHPPWVRPCVLTFQANSDFA